MPAGDIASVTIGADGWFFDVAIVGLTTGGTFAERLGLGANYDPATGTPKAVFTVTSKSKTVLEADTTLARTVYGTKQVRWPSTTKSVAGSYTSGTFTEGETVTQAVSGATGVVAYPGGAGPKLYIHTVTGTPNNSNIWTGGTSAATFTPTATPAAEGTDAAPNARVFFNGTNTIIRIALSSYIYAKDKAGGGNSGTDVAYTFLAGIYSQGGTDSAAASGTATNNSTATYQTPIYNWTWVPFERITGTFKLRALAFDRHGQQGKPVRAIIFSATDGTNTVTQTVETPIIDAAMSADQVPVVEYVASLDPTTLAQGAEITCNFKVIPWVGETVFNSSTGAAQPTPLVGPIKLLNDRTGAYGAGTYAVVDVATGTDPVGFTLADDAGKWVGTGDPTLGSGTAYATIGHAARAIRNYNNNAYGRDDVGGGIVYVKAGSNNWLGRTVTGGYGATPKTWITVKPYPGVTRAAAIISGLLNNPDISDMVKIEGMTITTTTNNTFSSINHLWFNDCEFNTSGAGIVVQSGAGVWYVTHSKLTLLAQGLRPSSTQNKPCAIVRGNELAGFAASIMCFVVIGNKRSSRYASSSTLLRDSYAGQTMPDAIPIIAFNEIYGWDATSNAKILDFGGEAKAYIGHALVQNLFELTNTSTGSIGDIGASESFTTNTPLDNFIIWHNTFVGQRVQFGYNSSGSTLKHRRYWSVKNNYWDIPGAKSDTFTTVNGARQGNWPLMWGVDFSGNVAGNVDEIATPGFDFEVIGLSSIDTDTANDPSYPAFTDRKSYIGTAGTGLGDYTTTESSPLRDVGMDLVMPFDLSGNARTASNNDAGAFASNIEPTISDQPDSATKTEGQSVTFTVVASGTPNPTYQWRKNGVNIGGATSDSYTIPSVSESDEADYDVVVSNSEGSVTSNIASLTVNPSGGGSGGPCDVQALLDSGKCFYGTSHLEAIHLALWCEAAQVIADS